MIPYIIIVCTVIAIVSLLFLFGKLFPTNASSQPSIADRMIKELAAQSAEPRIIVNVPADYKPMPMPPDTTIEGARAALWYAVFQKARDSDAFLDDSVEAANSAVDKCFP